MHVFLIEVVIISCSCHLLLEVQTRLSPDSSRLSGGYVYLMSVMVSKCDFRSCLRTFRIVYLMLKCSGFCLLDLLYVVHVFLIEGGIWYSRRLLLEVQT